MDGQALAYTEFLHQQSGRFMGKILLIIRQIKQVGFYLDARLLGNVQINPVMKPHGLHDHPHLVIAVSPPSQYIQSQINLSICF